MRKYTPWFLLIGLSCLSLVLFTGCPEDDDDSASDDDDDAAGVEIEATFPQDGATDFYYRYNIWVEFTDEVSGASITLTDAGGTEITGSGSMNDNNTELTFDPGEFLTPSTAYTATISWDDHADVDLGFQTSAIGTPAGDPQNEIVGNDYFLDLGTAEFTEPPGVGGILSQYIADVYVIAHIKSIDEGAGTMEVYGGIVDKEGNDYVQDLCTETLPMTDEEPGTWDNPYMQIGPTDFHLSIEGYEATIAGLKIGGSFASDGSMLVGGTFDGQMDTRVLDDLIDPGAKEGAACELLASLGIECESCPDGSGDFCLTVSAHSIVAEAVSITGVNPETKEAYTTLTEVSADDIAGWVKLGVCDPPE